MKQPRVARLAGAASVTTLSVGPRVPAPAPTASAQTPNAPTTPYGGQVAALYAELERQEDVREIERRAARWADDGPAVADVEAFFRDDPNNPE
jgi:hypothetical protein